MRDNSRYHRWTADEEEYVRKYFGKIKQTEIADHLKMTRNQVKGRAYRLGLKTPDAIILERRIIAGLGNFKNAGLGEVKLSVQLKNLKTATKKIITHFSPYIEQQTLDAIVNLNKLLNQ